jgi:ribosomal protein S27E
VTEHHGLDLDAIERASGGHSIFAPSAAAMWLTCAGSLIPNITAPDDAGYDAAYGTVGHGVAETWLKRIKRTLVLDDAIAEGRVDALIDECAPRELIGTVETVQERVEAFEILIDEEMFDYIREYIVWCAEAPGEHYIEERVYFSNLTPLKKQGGTADFSACAPTILRIRDLKLGKGEQVFAAYVDLQDKRSIIDGVLNGNPQAMLYALGFFYKYDAEYHFERIEIGIGQPRMGHFQVWETTREELLRFADFAKERAFAAWVPDAPRTPSPKGCRWCKVQRTCPAFAKVFLETRGDGVFDVCDEETGEEVGWTGQKCPDCRGSGQVFDDRGEEVSCIACGGTGDEYDSGSAVIEGEFHVVTRQQMAAVKAEISSPAFELTMGDPAELSTEQMAKLLQYRKLVERFFESVTEELTVRAKAGEKVPGYKLVAGREGDRKWRDEKSAAQELQWLGLAEEDLHKRTLLTPAQAEAVLKKSTGLKKNTCGTLIADLVVRAPGKDTLAPVTDKREELEERGAVFDADMSDGDL